MCSAIVNGLTRFMAFTFFHRTHLVFLGAHWVGAVWVLFGCCLGAVWVLGVSRSLHFDVFSVSN